MLRVKPSTSLHKIVKAYCEVKDLARDSLRFLFDGDRIPETATKTRDSTNIPDFQENGHQRDANLCGAYARPTDERSLVRGGGVYNQGSFVYCPRRVGCLRVLNGVVFLTDNFKVTEVARRFFF